MFSLLKKFTSKIGIYDHLRYSWAYEQILRIRTPDYIDNLDADFAFYRQLLGERRVKCIFDIGANSGEKTWVFARLAEKVVCVEPDPDAVATLHIRFSKNKHIHLIPSALGSEAGDAELYRLGRASAFNSLSSKHATLHGSSAGANTEKVIVQVTTLDDLVATFGVPDFLKVDVEGFELEVFSGMNSPVPLLSFEANLPEFADETSKVIERLLVVQPQYRFNAVSNDTKRDWAFDNWQDASTFNKFVAGIGHGSIDIYATTQS